MSENPEPRTDAGATADQTGNPGAKAPVAATAAQNGSKRSSEQRRNRDKNTSERPRERNRTRSGSSTAPQEIRRLYVQLNPNEMVAIHVRNEDYSGDYFTRTLTGTQAQRLEQTLETAISTAPNYCTFYIHSSSASLREYVRGDRTPLPEQIRSTLRRRNIVLRVGSVTKLEGFWQDLLGSISQEKMPEIGPLANYVLYTYGVTDGLRSYAGGILQGEGQIHAQTVSIKGSSFAPAELELAAWATELLGYGKSIEIRHHHPETTDFWTGSAEEFVGRYPEVESVSKRIGHAIERQSLHFELPNHRRENVISRAARELVGRSLG